MTTLFQKIQRIEKLKTIARNRQAYLGHRGTSFLGYRAGLLSAQMDIIPDQKDNRSDEALLQYAENVRHGCTDAARLITQHIQSGEELSIDFIQDLHTSILKYAAPEKAGQWRTLPARWKNSTMIVSNYQKIRPLIHDLVDGVNQGIVPAFYWDEHPNPNYQATAYHPVMQAIQMNYDIVSIHPFGDGNKRLAKALSNWILMRSGFAPMTITDRERYISSVENYYNTRDPNMFHDTMFREIEQSHRETIREIDTFIQSKQKPRAISRYISQTRHRLNEEILKAKTR